MDKCAYPDCIKIARKKFWLSRKYGGSYIKYCKEHYEGAKTYLVLSVDGDVKNK